MSELPEAIERALASARDAIAANTAVGGGDETDPETGPPLTAARTALRTAIATALRAERRAGMERAAALVSEHASAIEKLGDGAHVVAVNLWGAEASILAEARTLERAEAAKETP